MKTFLRTPIVRLVLGAVVLVVGLALSRSAGVFGGDDSERLESSSEVPVPPTVEPVVNVAPEPAAEHVTTLDDLGAPDDPLPDPLPSLANGEPVLSDQGAEILARKVLEGGSDFFPSLITALQASGIGIIGPGNVEVTKPAAPWQGISMQRWEVRTAAAMVLPERSVTLGLPDLAAFLVEVLPSLKGAPVEKLIVDDLRAIANSQVPTTRFFGQFVAALGRNAASHDPYDLLGDVDPKSIRLNGLQVSLILRRLATDVVMRLGPANPTPAKTATLIDTLSGWFSAPVYAEGQPCSYANSTAMDVAAVASSLALGGLGVGDVAMRGLLERAGLDRFSSVGALFSTLLSYAQFIATYSSLEADVTMDRQPLVRTKKATETGERRELTAVVKLNLGNAQMANCFRGLLVAVGMDFRLPNDGPIKGARVSWYGVDGFDLSAAPLHGGSEAIVQFVSADTGPITDSVTGEDGKVRVGVEGRPQRMSLSNDATEVPKSAKVRLNVALQGADLFGDLQEAAGTAAGGLAGLATVPISILMRAQWASVGQYRFPVTDWREGPAEWSGTVTYTKVTKWNTASAGKAVHMEQTYDESLTVRVNVTETLEGSNTFGNAGAALKGTAQASYKLENIRTGGQLVNCARVISERKSLQTDISQGSGAGSARVSVGISADGQYSVTVYPEVTVTYRTTATSQLSGPDGRQQCAITSQSISSPERSASMPVSGDMIQGDGAIDPRRPNRLSGSTQETENNTTRTLTWDLQRN